MLRTSLSILFVGLCSLAVNEFLVPFGTKEYAVAMMAVDGIFATVILIRPAGRVQSLIGWTFLLQIMVHGGRLAAEFLSNQINMDYYWWGLTIPAMLQLALVLGWWLHDRIPWRRILHLPDKVAAASRRAGMGR